MQFLSCCCFSAGHIIFWCVSVCAWVQQTLALEITLELLDIEL